jgi:polyribonucleotide nucleotidyltransferase
MKQKITVSVPQAGNMQFSTGTVASLANGAVTVQLGETALFVSATVAAGLRPDQDFFPLTVDYREKAFAAGRFPGGYFRREGRPSEKEILTSRLCDRPCRPLFPYGFMNEVQIIGMLLSADQQNEADILMVNGASAALHISDIPWSGPIAAVRVGLVNGEFVANPTIEQQYQSSLDLIYVGTEKEMVMIEGSADQIPEEKFIEALDWAQKEIQPVIAAIKSLRDQAGKPKAQFELFKAKPEVSEIVAKTIGDRMKDAVYQKRKQDRSAAVAALKEEAKAAVIAALGAEGENWKKHDLRIAIEELMEKTYRSGILDTKARSDGRGPDGLRQISCDVDVLPRVHGSALFSRGETQALVVTTLGTTKDAQELDAITGGPKSKSFILHYNFPPFSVGETGRFGSPGRREIGHGALAERSLLPVIPPEDKFPYSIRISSEIMSSNGSTSMASVCGGTLALMDAGVPIVAPVAGISCGLVTEFDASGNLRRHVVLTDILGEEDHFGDMDFKICGTAAGITGFQLDLKIGGLPASIAKEAIYQNRTARLQILDAMNACIEAPRSELNANAPRITTIQIDPDKIGMLIGPGGKNIRRIVEITGAQIDINEDNSGRVNIYSTDKDAMDRAIAEINLTVGDIEENKIYKGRVVSIKEFGAFVEVLPGKDGLVHISELSDIRVRRVEDVCKVGDEMWVKCLGTDDRGKVKLSRRAAMAEREGRPYVPAEPAERGERPARGERAERRGRSEKPSNSGPNPDWVPGEIYDAEVTGTKDFGAFVEAPPGSGYEGLVHISELQEGRTRRTEDVVKVGDKVRVKFLGQDEKGRVRFSLKQASAPASSEPAAE